MSTTVIYRRLHNIIAFGIVLISSIACSVTKESPTNSKALSTEGKVLTNENIDANSLNYNNNIIVLGNSQVNIAQIPIGKKINTRELKYYGFKESLITTPHHLTTIQQNKINNTNIAQYIFISEEKELIGIATRYVVDEVNLQDNTYFELFSKDGELLWTAKESRLIPANCIFYEKEKIVGVNWVPNEEGERLAKLNIYNIIGEIESTIDNVGDIIYSGYSEHLYLMKDYYYSSNEQHKNTVYYKNLQTGASKEFQISNNNDLHFPAISKNGEYLLCLGNKDIVSISYKNGILWQTNRVEHCGSFFLSHEGKTLLNIKGGEEKFYTYNNLTGQIKADGGYKREDDYQGCCKDASFITDSIFAITTSNIDKSIVFNFYNINGDFIKSYKSLFITCEDFSIKLNQEQLEIYSHGVLQENIPSSEIR